MDIHNPSVPTTNGVNGINGSETKKSLAQLTLEKEKVESELSALSAVLDSVGRISPRLGSGCSWLTARSQHEHQPYNL
jgi:hypothetical protein